MSLYIRCRSPGGTEIGTATGFLVRHPTGGHFLVTNRHVFTGRHQDTGEPLSQTAATPAALEVAFPVRGVLGEWNFVRIDVLDDDERPVWLEHPLHGPAVDVVAYYLHGETDGLDLDGSYDVHTQAHLQLEPSYSLHVLGFPIGIDPTTDGAFAIWCQGTVASEPGIDWRGLPRFLIDSRTRQGQSGSPVVVWAGEPVLLGVYSGRIHPDSDLGTVWRASVVRDLVDAGVRPEA